MSDSSPGQSSLSAGALRYRAWAQSWSSAALAARSVQDQLSPLTRQREYQEKEIQRLNKVGAAKVRGWAGRRKAVRDRFALQGGTGDFP